MSLYAIDTSRRFHEASPAATALILMLHFLAWLPAIHLSAADACMRSRPGAMRSSRTRVGGHLLDE